MSAQRCKNALKKIQDQCHKNYIYIKSIFIFIDLVTSVLLIFIIFYKWLNLNIINDFNNQINIQKIMKNVRFNILLFMILSSTSPGLAGFQHQEQNHI